jgi:hypothetical protein
MGFGHGEVYLVLVICGLVVARREEAGFAVSRRRKLSPLMLRMAERWRKRSTVVPSAIKRLTPESKAIPASVLATSTRPLRSVARPQPTPFGPRWSSGPRTHIDRLDKFCRSTSNHEPMKAGMNRPEKLPQEFSNGEHRQSREIGQEEEDPVATKLGLNKLDVSANVRPEKPKPGK